MIAEGLLAPLQRRGISLPRPRPRVLAAVLALLLALGGGWLWLRDSSLVGVDHVVVTGASGADGRQIRSALISAARNMTTLDVRLGQLRTAVAPYPVVKDLRVTTQFPHGMRIRVIEQIPVGVVVANGRTMAVAADGTLLHDVPATGTLPSIPLKAPPGGDRLSDPAAVQAVEVLGAAPYPLLPKISQVMTVSGHGLVAQLRSGPSIYFGDTTKLAAKWAAALAVLADPGSAGALYIDVTDPGRPAAGGGSAAAASAAAAGAATSGAATSSPAAASGTSAGAGPASTGSSGVATTPTGG